MRREPVPHKVSLRAARIIDHLSDALGDQVVGIICTDSEDRLCIIPQSGAETGLIAALAEADWARMLRIAEEWTA